MPRRPCCRRIHGRPGAAVFRPAGTRPGPPDRVVMRLDEFEAVRLADLEGLYQAQAAARMEVSRATFGRILAAAHRKLAEVLVHGRGLAIEGGPVTLTDPPTRHCPRCDHAWQPASPETPPEGCPRCRRSSACPRNGTPKEERQGRKRASRDE